MASGCATDEPDSSAVLALATEVPELLPEPTSLPLGEADAAPDTARADTAPDASEAIEPVDAAGATDSLAGDVAPDYSCLPERARLAQLLTALVVQSDLEEARGLASIGELGGIGFLGSPDAGVADAIAAIQQSSLFVPVMVASDEEGGSVQRLAELLGPLPSAATTATTMSPEQTRAQWVEYGSRLRNLGINVVFGPVVDVGAAPGIGSRSFGDDPLLVTEYAAAVADGLAEAGITPVFKHFPGHGRASGDSHLGLPLVPSIDELRTSDLVPYVQLVGANQRDDAGVMIAHLTVPGLSEDVPTSLSSATIDGLLRQEIGFGGLVFSDALNMGAIVQNFGAVDAIERSLMAGADIAILGSLSDVGPAIDHLQARIAVDPPLAAALAERLDRVMAAKGQTEICVGAR